ncbi:hypothetical protein AB1Y20_014261 [Prymnesium parvum]|uniref:RRM domain-containing protein n=1 Tax=Prymnesium parvum TaxID=97485 RepID=A0AB34IDI4_PRYPA
MSKLSLSLDDLIKSDREGGSKSGRGAGAGGAVRSGRGRPRAAPYSRKGGAARDEAAPEGTLERRGRGTFQYGKGAAKGGGGGGGGGGGKDVSLYVGNLAFSVTWQQLKEHLASAGDVRRVDVATRADGRSRGFAIVQFATAAEARNAIRLYNETELEGRLLTVRGDDGSSQVHGGKRGGGGGGGGGGRGGLDEPDDGYSHSGRTGRNGWVKPEGGEFVDDGPPPEPRSMLR